LLVDLQKSGSEELRHRARRESDGCVGARLIAIANALEGYESGQRSAAGRDGPPDLA
jgi:hypothetical protein